MILERSRSWGRTVSWLLLMGTLQTGNNFHPVSHNTLCKRNVCRDPFPTPCLFDPSVNSTLPPLLGLHSGSLPSSRSQSSVVIIPARRRTTSQYPIPRFQIRNGRCGISPFGKEAPHHTIAEGWFAGCINDERVRIRACINGKRHRFLSSSFHY